MEPPKYYDINNGLFCVHFPNKRGLSIEEIKRIFSEFGEVATVRASGDNYGYRFVQYKNEDEVIRCVEGLRNHQFIKLKVKDPKFKTNRNPINDNNVAGISYGQKNYEHKGQQTEFNDNRNRQGFGRDGITDNNQKYITNNNSTPQTEDKHFSMGEQRIIEARRGTNNAYNHDTDKQKLPQLHETYPDPSKPATSLQRPAVAPETFMPVHAKTCQDHKNNSMTSYGISLEVQNANAQVFCNDAQNIDDAGPLIESKGVTPCVKPNETAESIPSLIMQNSAYNTTPNDGKTKSPQSSAEREIPKSEIAKDIVVANIHTDFGVNYILHLFRKYNPLSISEMKIVPTLGLRFCIVYLQSLHQAYAIEQEFDRFKLSGKDLIVLRCERLVELSA